MPITLPAQAGEAVTHRGITLVPLFPRRNPAADYVTLQPALRRGLVVAERGAEGSVPELVVTNPLGQAVLLYDGEELLGAKQNRILNVTVLVAAKSETQFPVSCVEQGRWTARGTSFQAARHAAYPELRRRKAEQLSAEPLVRGLAQGAVWDEVAAKAGRHGVASPTSAAADIYARREADLANLREAFPLAAGQSGAVLGLGDMQLCLDYVSRPAAFAQLYPKLLDGYLLDALERLDGRPASAERIRRFVTSVEAAPTRRSPSAGVGDDVRLARNGVVGSGLVLREELLQASAFTTDRNGPRTRVARPSRRR